MRPFSFISGVAVGAAAVWFLDPDSGAQRRSMAQATAQRAGGQVKGAATQASPVGGRSADDLNDAGLKAKVESEIFRDQDAPKGQVSVDVADGVVTLRGELGAEDQVSKLEQDASGVDGVREVRNLISTAS